MQCRLSNESTATVQADKNVCLTVFVSFAEIYNDDIYDVLVKPTKRQHLHLGNDNDTTFIKKLRMVPVCNSLQTYQILLYGLTNLTKTISHCIFTIKLVQTSSLQTDYNVSYFSFCDLNGLRLAKKTLNVNVRLKEENDISMSLLVLHRCIILLKKIHKNKKLIPFHESKLTLLLKRALLGIEDISMIATMNPLREVIDDSINTVNFSAISKETLIDQATSERYNRFLNYMQSGSSSSTSSTFDENKSMRDYIRYLKDVATGLEYDNEFFKNEVTFRSHSQRVARWKFIETRKPIRIRFFF